MNIVHVVENLNRGGLERMVIDLATMQQRQGHCCRVVCLFEAGALAEAANRVHIGTVFPGRTGLSTVLSSINDYPGEGGRNGTAGRRRHSYGFRKRLHPRRSHCL